MATKSNSQRVIDLRKKRQEENNNNKTSSTNNILRNSDKAKKLSYERTINFNTLQTDLTNLSKTINNAYNGWQPRETMENTRASVQSMYDRLGKYQEYQKKYGGTDLSEIQSAYKSVLDGWGDLSSTYGLYKNADAYKKETETLRNLYSMSSSDVKTEMDKSRGLEDAYKTAKKYQSEISTIKNAKDYASKRSGLNLDNAISERISSAETKLNNYLKSVGYNSFDDLEKAYKGKKGNVAYTTASGQNILWQDLYDDASSREYTQKVMQNPKFESTSGYEKKDVKYESAKFTPQYKGATDEFAHIYNLINGDTDAIKYEEQYNVNIVGTNDDIKYKYITDEERRVFNSIEKTQGKEKALEYAKMLSSDLRQRRIEFEKKYHTQMAQESPVGSSVASVIANVGNNAMAIPFLAMDYFEDGNIDADDPLYTNRRTVNTTRSAVEGMIDNNVGQFFYRHGMNVADNLAARAVSLGMGTGAASQFLMSSGSAVDTVLDAKERGLSDEQAIGLGAISGAAEWYFESKGFEAWVDTKTLKRGAWDYFVNSLKTELVGELSTEFTNDVADYFIAQDLNKLNIEYTSYINSGLSEKDAMKKVVGGVVSRYADVAAGTIFSTGAMSGPGSVIGGISQHSYNKAKGQTIKSNERVQEVFDIASNPEVASAYETYTRYANKGINAENISDTKLGNLYTSARADAVETLRSKKATAEQRKSAFETLAKLSVAETENTVKKEARKLNVGEETKVTETGETFNVKDFKVKGEEVTVATEKGDISVDDTTLSQRDAELVVLAKGVAQTDGDNAANLFLSMYNGQTDVYEYDNSFNLTMEYAKKNYSYDTILNNKGSLTTEQVKAIYRKARIEVDKSRAKAIKELNKKMADKKFYKGVINDSVIDYDNTSAEGKVNWNDLDARQRQAVTFIKGFAQATGMNLVLEHNPKSKYGGKYEVEDNTITIDISKYYDKAMNLQETIIPTMSHETTHWMKEKSPELWRNLNEIVFSTLTEHYNSNTEQAIKDKIDLLNRLDPRIKHTEEDAKEANITEEDLIRAEMNRKGKSEEVSREEIIARACEDMLKMSKQGRKIFNSLSEAEQKTFVEKIKAIINDLLTWVDELLNSYESTSTEARIMREYKTELQKASKVWDAMLEQSVEANQSLEKSGAFEHQGNVDGEVAYEIREGFYTEFDEWVADGRKDTNIRFVVGKTSDVLKSIGMKDHEIILPSGTINQKLKKHSELTVDIVRNIPDLLEHPVIIQFSDAIDPKTNKPKYDSRITLLGELYADMVIDGKKEKKPVLVSMELLPTNQKKTTVLDFSVITSVYGHSKLQQYLNDNSILYIDPNKKRTNKWLSLNRLQLPLGETKYGSIRRITYSDNKVKIQNSINKTAMELALEKAGVVDEYGNAKFSDRDSTGRELSKGQQEYFKESAVRDDNGNLKVMYRGDTSEFTVFDRKKTKHSNLYGRGFYFTDNKAHASQYGEAREFYLDIKNPLSPKQNVITKKQMLNFLKAIENDGEDYDLYNYGQDATAESVLNSVWGKGDFEMLQDVNAGAIGDLVAAVELFNKVNGTSYDGIILPTETVTFNSEQAKYTSNLNPTKDKDVRFSMRDNVEETKDLVAVHNMQVSELERTLDLGGLPMPSIAIIKAQSGHSEYGDVSLVFNKETIDPKADKNNKVYGGDAWTPTYPTIEYKPNEKISKKISDKYYELSRKFGYDESRPLYNYVYELEEQLNRHKGESELISELYEDTRMMQLYLLDSGKSKVETIKKEVRTELTDAEVQMNEFFIKELGSNVVDEIMWDGNGTPMSYRKNYLSKYEDAIREAYKKLLSEEYHFTDEQVQNVMDSTKNNDLIKFMRDAHKYRENGRVTTKTEDDYEATQKAIKDAAGEGYYKWVDNLFKGIEEKSGIRNNTDYFTNSGNRRSWEALHWENNLENVVKVMKSQNAVGGGAFFSGLGIWGVSAKDYRSIEEMKADADRLKQLPEEEYNKIKEGFGDRLMEIAHSIMDKSERNPFIASDNAMECIIEAVRNSKTKSGILKNLKEYRHLTVTETTVDDIVSLVTDISNMPTEYFEAKPHRAVELNEIATAIIPNNTSAETKARLDNMGIKYLEYESGNEGSRLEVLNSLEEVKFSDRDSEGNTLTKEQQEFFKDSKVRDAEGNLLVCYHGTNSKFTVFSKDKIGIGYWFSTDKNYASEHGNITISVYLNITNPLEENELWEQAIKCFGEQATEEDIFSKSFKIYLQKLGYDGITFKHSGSDTFIAFSPEQIKLTSNTNPTSNPDTRFSDREDTDVYDLMGEKDRLLKENEKLKADVGRLRERLKIEKQVTHGNYFNENQLGAVATHLRKISRSNMDKVELMKGLKDLYSFIAQSPQLTWEEVYIKSYRIAEEMLKDARPEVMVDEYYKAILSDFKKSRISLSDSQKAEAKHRLDKNWNRRFYGKIIITDKGTPIEMQWQEWQGKYGLMFSDEVVPDEMIVELYDIIENVKQASEVVEEYDSEEQKRWLANEIYNQYWNVSTIKTTADKYDKQIKRLNYEHRKAMSELRDDYNTRLKEQHKADKEKQKKLVNEIRERKDKQIALAKEHGKAMLEGYKDRAEQKTRIQSITSNILSLKDLLVKNSKDKHVPEAMKGPVKALIDSIDFSSKRLLEKGIPTKKDISLQNALRQVSDMMIANNSATDAVVDLYGAGLDEKIKSMMKSVDRMTEGLNGKEFVLQMMSSEDLKTLDNMVKVIKASVNKLNKFHVAQHNAGVEALGIATTEDVDKAKKIYEDHKKHFDKMKTKTYWNMLNPYYAFKNLGTHAMKIMNAFMDGQDKVAFLAKEVIDFAESVYTNKEYKKWENTFFDFEIKQPSGKVKKFSMNVPQIMSLYCVSKQEDARRHLIHGVEDGENKGKGRGITLVETDKTEAVRNNILLTEADLNNIIAKLDEVDRAKEVADRLQEFMSTRGAELGNEISMARWGIKSFGIENYFPIKVSDGAVPTKGETPGVQGNPLISLLNMSFTHSRNQFASQSIEIGNVFDVFSNHMSSMIQYNAMALPVLDMYKWLNCKVETNHGEEISVKTSINDTFGEHAWDYFNTFLKDINGSTKNNTRDSLGVKFFKNAKVAKVALNIRVALLQFTSYIRAGAVMDNKYLLKALFHKPKIKKSMEHCGIALWKSMGYYETDVTRPLSDKIKHSEDLKSKMVDITLKGAEFADKLTWGVLWNACELEVRETRKDLKVGSEEFYNEIGLRLREVVYRTQVVDSQLTRSQIMRSKDKWDNVLTMFASESTLSFNLITDLFVSYKLDSRRMGKEAAKQKNAKYIRKAIVAYAVTNIVTTAISTMFDAFRDYDEDDKDEEYILKLMLENFASNSSFINKIPYINLFVSIISGFSASRVETDWMESTTKGVKEIYKLLTGEGSGEKAFKHILKALSDASGIAAYNLYRDIMALYKLFE